MIPVLDLCWSGLDDLDSLSLGSLNGQGGAGRPLWVNAGANVTVVIDPGGGAGNAIYLPGGAAASTLSTLALPKPLFRNYALFTWEAYFTTTQTGCELVIDWRTPSSSWLRVTHRITVAGTLDIYIGTATYHIVSTIAANDWKSFKALVDPVAQTFTFLINGQVINDQFGTPMVDRAAEWVASAFPLPPDLTDLALENVNTATAVGEDAYVRRALAVFGDRWLTSPAEEPIVVAELETGVGVIRRYSDLTRIALVLTNRKTLAGLFDGRALSFGEVTEELPLLVGDVVPTEATIALKAPPAQSQGPVGTVGTYSGDRAVIPGDDARSEQSFFRRAQIKVGYPWAEYNSLRPAAEDWRLVYAGRILGTAFEADGSYHYSLGDHLSQVLGETKFKLNQAQALAGSVTFPTVPVESQTKVLPVLYGTLAKSSGTTRGRLLTIPMSDLAAAGPWKFAVAGHILLATGSTSVGINVVYLKRNDTYTTLAFGGGAGQWTGSYGVIGGIPVTYLTITGPFLLQGDEITVDCQGYADPAAPTTLLINPSKVLEHLLTNWTELTAYGVGLDTAAIAATAQVCTDRGYLAAGALTEPLDVAEVIRLFCNSFNFRPRGRNDQITGARVFGWDIFELDLTGEALAPEYDSRLNMADIRVEESGEWLANRVTGLWGQDPVGPAAINPDDFHTGEFDQRQVKDSVTGQAAMNNRVTAYEIEMAWVQDAATAGDVLLRVLAEFALPTMVLEFTAPLAAHYLELGSLLKATHHDAVAPGGRLLSQLCEVIGRSLNLDDFSAPVRIRARSLRNLAAQRLLGDDRPDAVYATDPDRILTRVPVGTATAALVGGTYGVTTSVPITAVVGDKISFGNFDETLYTVGVKNINPNLSNFFTAYLGHQVTKMTQLGQQFTQTAWGMFADVAGTGRSALVNQNPVDFYVLRSWRTAEQVHKNKYWFLADETTEQFSDGTPIFRLF